MVEVRNAARIQFVAEGSIAPSRVQPTTMPARRQPQSQAALAVQLSEGLWLAASPTQTWLSAAAPDTTQAITAPAVRSLLEGAVAAARSLAAPRPPLTATQWIWRLVGFVHLTHSAPALLEFAAERFAADRQPAIARWAEARAHDHAQHHLVVLRDLRAMGVDPARALAALRPHPAERLVAWLRASVLADPTACIGYVHAVERLALRLGADELQALEATLPDGVRATRCVQVRDNHLDETVTLLTRLSATRCEAVARAVFDVACLCVTPQGDGYPDDIAIADQLRSSCELQPEQ
ncbi:MAG TPA: hypothetical protein VM869_20040 [Enhygromyxa sp.]|nr:hypothetical protein [Enhygromyxa sp.]